MLNRVCKALNRRGLREGRLKKNLEENLTYLKENLKLTANRGLVPPSAGSMLRCVKSEAKTFVRKLNVKFGVIDDMQSLFAEIDGLSSVGEVVS